MNPKEAFEEALVRALLGSSIRHGPHGRPGEVIQKLSKEAREAIKDLKPNDIQDRVSKWFIK